MKLSVFFHMNQMLHVCLTAPTDLFYFHVFCLVVFFFFNSINVRKLEFDTAMECLWYIICKKNLSHDFGNIFYRFLVCF